MGLERSLQEAHHFELATHIIGSESATEPAVGWFRFEFEEEGKVHRGASDKHPTSGGFPRGVTVKDVMQTWTKLKGERTSLIGTSREVEPEPHRLSVLAPPFILPANTQKQD